MLSITIWWAPILFITRASQYLDGYSVGIEARGNGKIAVAMTVDGTGIMEKIGVAEVEIEYKTNVGNLMSGQCRLI